MSLDALLSLRPKSIAAPTPPQTPQHTRLIVPTAVQTASAFVNQADRSTSSIKPVSISTKALNKPLSSSIVLMSGNNLAKLKQQQYQSPASGFTANGSKQIFNTMSFIKPVQASCGVGNVDKTLVSAGDSSGGMVNKRMVIYKVEPSDTLKNNDRPSSELMFK